MAPATRGGPGLHSLAVLHLGPQNDQHPDAAGA
jgi:hypothetical protein